jgi:hypothetical protein
MQIPEQYPAVKKNPSFLTLYLSFIPSFLIRLRTNRMCTYWGFSLEQTAVYLRNAIGNEGQSEMSTDVLGLFCGHRSIVRDLVSDTRKGNRRKERGNAEEFCLQRGKWRMAALSQRHHLISLHI